MASLFMPWLLRSMRSFLFSSATLRATTWISAEASMPWTSTSLRRCSSSWTYSLRLARERLWFSRMRARFAFSYIAVSYRMRWSWPIGLLDPNRAAG